MNRQPAALNINWRKVGIVLAALFLFILSIQLLKSGARALVPWVQVWAGGNPLNALGFGWLAAYLVLSGSPIAALSLTLLDAGAVEAVGALAMVAGSRLGASFIVLAVGFVYVLRGHSRTESLSMGLLALFTTFLVQLPSLATGYVLLKLHVFDSLSLGAPGAMFSFLEVVFDPPVWLAESLLPRSGVFLLGFGVLWYSLNLIDRGMPDLHLRESAEIRQPGWATRPMAAFALGLGVTSITMSVSVSLSLLVPLAVRGIVRRGNVIPYIMGANITTFIDTLVVALLLNNPLAPPVVLAEMVSVLVISLLILLLAYRPCERGLLFITDSISASNRTLAIFLLVIVGVPVALMLIR